MLINKRRNEGKIEQRKRRHERILCIAANHRDHCRRNVLLVRQLLSSKLCFLLCGKQWYRGIYGASKINVHGTVRTCHAIRKPTRNTFQYLPARYLTSSRYIVREIVWYTRVILRQCYKMADSNEKLLAELLKKAGNNVCADCGAKSPEWASYNIGIFVCTRCAGVHRSMGAHISKVKHLKLDRWEDSQVNRICEVGNIAARLHYEERVPPCYRRPSPDAPQVLVEQWIRAKYEREEFCHPERQNHYVSGFMEGFLMKRGKEDSRYHPRKFVLCEAEDTLKYHVKENKEPKAVLRISELNVAFAPPKTGNQNTLQISFMKDGTTRHIYVYHEDPEVITNWYLAIRCAKLHRLQVAYPGASEAELLSQLTRDFPREGFLWKTGPRHTDAYKKRWFTLDGRKLMYHDDPMDAHPKGEIFVGHSSEGFVVKAGVPSGARDQGFSFTLETPDRTYLLSAQNDDDRSQWMAVIQKVIDKPLTPQDATVAARLVRKRTASGTMNIFSSTR